MKNILLSVLLTSILICKVAIATEQIEYYSERQGDIVVMLVGEGLAYERKVPNLKGKATCFDVDMIDMASNANIGKATDCLSEIEVDENGNINLIGTTIFKFKQGKLITQGALAVRPIDFEMATASGMPVTHITGANREGNTIVRGTKAYENAEANVRLSGMVNMSRLESSGIMEFNCIFVISNIELN